MKLVWILVFLEMSSFILSARNILRGVVGINDRKNDLIVIPAKDTLRSEQTIVFFGGDVQDFEENMKKHKDNRKYAQWSLEKVADLLAESSNDKDVVVVKPSEMRFGTLSCFHNFVISDSLGCPTFNDDHGALAHLRALLSRASSDLNINPPMNGKKLVLIGFSKGTVVLNQIVHELSGRSRTCENDIVFRINKMCWLDGGHNGGKDTWITEENLLKGIVSRNIEVDVRVTPYQMTDQRRPWIGKEEATFVQILNRLGAQIKHNYVFKDEKVSIENHFKVISTFKESPP